MNQQRWLRRLGVAGALGLGIWLLGGCDDSAERAAQRQARASVNESGRLMLSSGQEITLTESEIAGDGRVSPEQVVNRLERDAGAEFGDLDALLAEIDGELEQLKLVKDAGGSLDDQTLQQLAGKLLAASGKLQAERGKLTAASTQEGSRRLSEAKTVLNDALKLAGPEGGGAVQVGPQMMLGTLNLFVARAQAGLMQMQDLAIGSRQTEVGRLVVALQKLATAAGEAETYPPDDALAALQELLDGSAQSAGLKAQLEAAEGLVAKLKTDRQRASAVLEENEAKAGELYREYLAVMEQAEKVHGEERYRLKNRAYELRAGRGEGAQRVEGGIHYEAETELAQTQLSIVEAELARAELRRDQLSGEVQQVTQAVEELQNQSSFAVAAAAQQRVAQQRVDLAADMEQLLNEGLKPAETHYRELRIEAVGGYREAAAAFDRAARAAGRRDSTGRHAEKLAALTRAELAGLWRADAAHYDSPTVLLQVAEEVAETSAVAKAMQEDHEELRKQAEASANELETENEDNG